MTAKDILKLLAQKHHKDLFVCECKNGPTWTGQHARLDAWALRRSWVNPQSWGYEIKVSRSDFLAEKRAPEYMAVCNSFYYVCPGKEIIRPEEVPEGAGLIYVSKTGTRLYTKRKAQYRKIEEPVDLYKYLLFSRVRVLGAREGFMDKSDRTKEWRLWLEEHREFKDVGYRVSKRLREVYERDVQKTRILCKQLERRIKQRINPECWSPCDKIQRQIRALSELIDPAILALFRQVREKIGTIIEAVESAKTAEKVEGTK